MQVKEAAQEKAQRLAAILKEAQRLIDVVNDELLADLTITATNYQVITYTRFCMDEDNLKAAAETLEAFALE